MLEEGSQFHFIGSVNLFQPVLPVRSKNPYVGGEAPMLTNFCVKENLYCKLTMLQDAVRGERPTKNGVASW